MGAIIGGAASGVVVLLLVILCCCMRGKRKKMPPEFVLKNEAKITGGGTEMFGKMRSPFGSPKGSNTQEAASSADPVKV